MEIKAFLIFLSIISCQETQDCRVAVFICIDNSFPTDNVLIHKLDFAKNYLTRILRKVDPEVKTTMLMTNSIETKILNFRNTPEEIDKNFEIASTMQQKGTLDQKKCLKNITDLKLSKEKLVFVISDKEDLAQTAFVDEIKSVEKSHDILLHLAVVGLNSREKFEFRGIAKNVLFVQNIEDANSALDDFFENVDVCKELRSCESPPEIRRMKLVGICENKQKGGDCKVECEGSSSNNHNKKIVCLGKNIWFGEHICEGKCQTPTTIPNAEIIECEDKLHDEECLFKCNTGFYRAEDRVICKAGTWSTKNFRDFCVDSTLPTCKNPTLEQGYHLLLNNECNGKRVDQTCDLNCQIGYQNVDSETSDSVVATCSLVDQSSACAAEECTPKYEWDVIPRCVRIMSQLLLCTVEEGKRIFQNVNWEQCPGPRAIQECTLSCKSGFVSLDEIKSPRCVFAKLKTTVDIAIPVSYKWENVPTCVAEFHGRMAFLPLGMALVAVIVALGSVITMGLTSPYSLFPFGRA